MIKKRYQKMNKKVDIVYMWVDGSDTEWRKTREQTYNQIENKSSLEWHANVEWRFRNNNELKYSLRSLEKNFPNHGNVYLITNWQIPDFLDTTSWIQVIFHQDFMRAESLPSFNSKSIESYIPSISRLSELFLCMNDDFFFWDTFQITDFYNQKPIYYFHPVVKRTLELKWWMIIQDQFLKEAYTDYVCTNAWSCHAPKAIIKQDFLEMKSEFEHHFNHVQNSKFRNAENPSLLANFYPRWMVHKEKWIYGWTKWWYVESHHKDFDEISETFYSEPFFCINDTWHHVNNDDVGLIKIGNFLEKMFPEKSSFEK